MMTLSLVLAVLTADFSQEIGRVRPELHSTGFGPQICSCSQKSLDEIKSMGFRASRTHDWALLNPNERVCDNHHIYPMTHLDPKDPRSYHFGPTDYLLKRTREELGHEIFFRLGTSIEHSGPKVHFNALIPDDYDRVAENFAATVRHYNRGWANGYEWGIRYWEIWNEPDGENTMWCLPDGDLGADGKPDEARAARRWKEFVRFYVTVLKRLKGEFGDSIKVGGPALTSLYPNREGHLRDLLRACKAEGVTPDFVSWHFYVEDPEVIMESIRRARAICDEEGATQCELSLNEWHYFSFSDYDWPDLWSSDPEKMRKCWEGPRSHNGIDSSCFNLACLSQFQTSRLDTGFYYGCRNTGAWGYKDEFGRKYKVYHGLKMFGDFLRSGDVLCKGEIDNPDGPSVRTVLPSKSRDGQKLALLVCDYRMPETEIVIDVRGVPPNMKPVGFVHDESQDCAPAEFSYSEGRLTIKKNRPGSAAYRFVFEPDESPLRVVLTFDDALKDHLLIAAPMLEARGWRGCFNIVTDWVGKSPKFLTWEDVSELVRRGHEVTTHTKSHRNLLELIKIGNRDEVIKELTTSRDEIAKHVGFTPRYMCAPYVAQNQETSELCRKVGLRQMDVPRHGFGSNNCTRVRMVLEGEIAKGARRVDILHHGISAADHGGWEAFRNRDSFEAHLDLIKGLEEEGRIIVTDYDGVRSACALRTENWPRHGILSLSFDDRNLGDWEKAFPIFRRYEATACFCICGAIDAKAIEFARKAMDFWHEIALHGFAHRDADAALAKLGPQAYWESEMAPQIDACRAAEIPVCTFAYPNCRHTPETDALFRRNGFTRLRGRIFGVKNPNPYDPNGAKQDQWSPISEADDFFVPAVNHLSERMFSNVILGESYHTDIEDVMRAIARAGERGERLSLVSHGISPGAAGISMKTEWLVRILEDAGRLGVVVCGIR